MVGSHRNVLCHHVKAEHLPFLSNSVFFSGQRKTWLLPLVMTITDLFPAVYVIICILSTRLKKLLFTLKPTLPWTDIGINPMDRQTTPGVRAQSTYQGLIFK